MSIDLLTPALNFAQESGTQNLVGLSTAAGPVTETLLSDRGDVQGRMLAAAARALQCLSLACAAVYHLAQFVALPHAVAAGAVVVLTPVVCQYLRCKLESKVVDTITLAVESLVVVAAKAVQVAAATLLYSSMVASVVAVSAPAATILTALLLTAWTFHPQLRSGYDAIRFQFSEQRKEWLEVRQSLQDEWTDTECPAGLLKVIVDAMKDKAETGGRNYSGIYTELEQVIQGLAPSQVDSVLDELLNQGLESGLSALDAFVEHMSLQQVQDLARHKNPELHSVVTDPRGLAERLHPILKTPANIISRNDWRGRGLQLETRFEVYLHQFLSIMDGIFPFEDLLSLDADVTKSAAKQLFISGSVATTLLSLLPDGWGGSARDKVIVIIGIAFLIWACKKLQPRPVELSHCENLVLEETFQPTEPVFSRDDEIDRLIERIGDPARPSQRHPVLVGKAGAGTTAIVRGLAQRIANDHQAPGLSGVRVFRINTKELCSNKTPEQQVAWLNRLTRRIRGQESKVLLFFDDIHAAVPARGNEQWGASQLLEALEVHIRDDCANQVHIIASTTPEGRERLQAGALGVCDLLEPMEIEDFSDDQLIELMENRVRIKAPTVWVARGAMRRLVERTTARESNRSKLKRVQERVDRAIRNLLKDQECPTQMREDQLSLQAATRRVRAAQLVPGHDEEISFHFEREELIRNIRERRQQMEAERTYLEQLKRLRGMEAVVEERCFMRHVEILKQSYSQGRRGRAAKELLLGTYVLQNKLNLLGDDLVQRFTVIGVRLDNLTVDEACQDAEQISPPSLPGASLRAAQIAARISSSTTLED